MRGYIVTFRTTGRNPMERKTMIEAEHSLHAARLARMEFGGNGRIKVISAVRADGWKPR